ncbi:hypothetical protein [Bosea sp. TAF32]|uniref:hypothetical protein n=1 Tax=Bosea sp. TAF32 TaxID=3237482 RepID=UPI003F8DBCEE
MTPEQKAGLARLMLRWPERREQLKRAAERCIDLYEGYELAWRAYVRWTQQTEPNAAAIAEEYRKILIELELEIAGFLAGDRKVSRRSADKPKSS